MKCKGWLCVGAAMMMAGSAVWAQTQSSVGGVYTCVDAKGRRLTSDRPIPECLDREQRVLNSNGTLRTKIGPALSAQEQAVLAQKEQHEAEERSRQLEERRRDRALLIRYPNQALHDQERAAALAQIDAATQAAKERLQALVKERTRLDGELAFYKNDPAKAPAYVRRQVDDNTQSQAEQQRFIAGQDQEARRVNARFDEELQRLRQLWAGNMTPTTSTP